MKKNRYDGNEVSAKYVETSKLVFPSTLYSCISKSFAEILTDTSTNATRGLIIASTGALSSTGGAGALFFDPSVCEWGRFSFYMPTDYKEGSNITPYIDWGTTSSTGSTQFVAWALHYCWDNIGSTSPASASFVNISSSCTTSILTMKTTSFTAMTGTGKNVGSLVNGTILRNSSGSTATTGLDDFSADALLFGLRFYYEKDNVGSTAVNGDK